MLHRESLWPSGQRGVSQELTCISMDLDRIILEGLRLCGHKVPPKNYYQLVKHHVKGCESRWKSVLSDGKVMA